MFYVHRIRLGNEARFHYDKSKIAACTKGFQTVDLAEFARDMLITHDPQTTARDKRDAAQRLRKHNHVNRSRSVTPMRGGPGETLLWDHERYTDG